LADLGYKVLAVAGGYGNKGWKLWYKNDMIKWMFCKNKL
jgi:hypothetical protein